MISSTALAIIWKFLTAAKAAMTVKVTVTVSGVVTVALLPVLTLEIVKFYAKGKTIKRENTEGFIRIIIIESGRATGHWHCSKLDDLLQALLANDGESTLLA